MKRLFGIGLVVALLGIAQPAHAATPVQISSNSIWSWWNSHIAQQTDRTIWTGITRLGDRRVYERVNGDTDYFSLGMADNPDDHNAPALSIEPDRPTLVFYTGHPGPMRYRVAPAGTIDFGPQLTVPWGFNTTYAQVLRSGSDVVVLARHATAQGWKYMTSNDDGTTWSGPYVFFNAEQHQSYVLLRPFDSDPLSFHVLAYWHPKYNSGLGYATVSFSDLITHAFTPVRLGQIQEIWSPSMESGTGWGGRLFDVADKQGKTIVYYQRWNAKTTTPQYYQAIRNSDSTWTSKKIISSGAMFYDAEGRYTPGMIFDRRPGVNRMYMGYKDGSTWKLVTREIDVNGNTTPSTLLDSGTKPLVRPVQVGTGVIYQKLLSYKTYRDYRAEIYQIEEL